MKTTMKIVAVAAAAAVFAGCSSHAPLADSELSALKASVEEARAAAMQSNQTSQQALALAQQNAMKIDRAFTKAQLK